ncbi:hypothetical protein Bca52824_033275 [Brassica carinata]|uniref:Uncharacterized protein n=1 Tax=Brassica carinata TaxID=52824 RepID=A0A8X7SCJ2_BRACI|nr:hypothetical protein Bca52824_033275 [Brassica carinata]
MVKRPRGRPSASKNKPKSPIIVTHDSPSSLGVHAVEISSGCETLSDFARRMQRGSIVPPTSTPWDHWFDHQGQVVGGLIASGHVVLMAASLMNDVFDRLPQDNDEAASMLNQQYYQNGRSHPLDNIHGLPQTLLTNGNSGFDDETDLPL